MPLKDELVPKTRQKTNMSSEILENIIFRQILLPAAAAVVLRAKHALGSGDRSMPILCKMVCKVHLKKVTWMMYLMTLKCSAAILFR